MTQGASHVATEPLWLRVALILLATGFLGLFLLLPLAAVIAEALRGGWQAYLFSCHPRARCAGRHSAHLDRGGYRGAAEPGVRHLRRLGHRQVRVPR